MPEPDPQDEAAAEAYAHSGEVQYNTTDWFSVLRQAYLAGLAAARAERPAPQAAAAPVETARQIMAAVDALGPEGDYMAVHETIVAILSARPAQPNEGEVTK